MKQDITFIGIDSSKKTNQVAMMLPDSGKIIEWSSPNEPTHIKKLMKKIKELAPTDIQVCYEAGPCGYFLQRQFLAAGIPCDIIAPSLIPVKPGERIKTDRRDAKKLCEYLCNGLLTTVAPPTEAEEAVRDVTRLYGSIRGDLLRARHRLNKLLLRHGKTWPGDHWTKGHRAWLKKQKFEQEEEQYVFEICLEEVERLEQKKRDVEERIEGISQQSSYIERVGWLRCFRGIDTVTAMIIITELHDIRRFKTARELMSYLGIVPSENSSGERRRQGNITKMGNKHVRRALIESAWNYRHRVAESKALRARRKGQPRAVIAIADRAMERLHKKYWKLVMQGKAHNKAVTAVARELVGFIWAVLVQTPCQEKEQTTTEKANKQVEKTSAKQTSRRKAA